MILDKLLKQVEKLGKLLGKVINYIVLGVIYWIFVAVTAVLGKAAGKKFLHMKSGQKSFWVDEKIEKETKKERYHRMI